MNRRIIFAESVAAGMFDPLDQIRPCFLLRNGAWTVAHRWERLLRPASVVLALRPWLKELAEETTGWPANQPVEDSPDDVWLILGTASPAQYESWKAPDLPHSFSWKSGHDSVIRLSRSDWSNFHEPVNQWIRGGGAGEFPCETVGHQNDLPLAGAAGLWDMVDHLGPQLEFDWNLWRAQAPSPSSRSLKVHSSAVVIEESRIWAAPDAEIGPHTVVDASAGPVILDHGAKIEPFCRLSGPAYVGRSTSLVGGKFTGPCAFGPGCKLGGEVETSIFQGFSNKAHEGFFGHGFVGEWANLGALTTNSDLKNTYGNVRVVRRGETADTGAIKVGSYLSDHTKTGIGTLLPTGATLGTGVNIVSGGLTPKSIPPFVWGGAGEFTEHDIERMLRAARIAAGRRAEVRAHAGLAGQMTPAEEDVLRTCFERSAGERQRFIAGPR